MSFKKSSHQKKSWGLMGTKIEEISLNSPTEILYQKRWRICNNVISFFQFIFAPILFKIFKNSGNEVLIESLS